MRLYNYSRSSASFRVRIALHLKCIPFESTTVDLLAGAQRQEAFRAINPQGLVPVLEDGGASIAQSLAALEYLDERFPEPPLLPPDAVGRARVRQLALIVACEIHPLQNLGALQALERAFGADARAQNEWARGVIERGLEAFERRLCTDRPRGPFCHGENSTLADLCLIPQLFNARKFDCDLSRFAALLEVEAACLEREAFRRACPEPKDYVRPMSLG